MITLRPYQEDVIMNVRLALARCRHVLIILSTGGGKTIIATFMALGASLKGKRIMFTCHRDFLIEQTSAAFKKVGIEHTFIASGLDYNPFCPVVIASMDTLKRRCFKVEHPDVLIVDEAIHSAAAGWANVIEYFQSKGSMTIGLCPCSERANGQGLGKWYKEIVLGPTMSWLIENGFLSKYKIFAPSKPDLSEVGTKYGEYINKELSTAMNKPVITGKAINEYSKLASGKRGVIFCCSIQHSKDVCHSFNEAGFLAVHIGSDTPKDERKSCLNRFRSGDIKILTSVDIFSEGFDLPAVEYGALLRPTKSLNIYLQQIGRILRAHPDKEFAYIADHANNVSTFGLPDEERLWTLSDKKKKRDSDGEKSIPVRECPKCRFCFHPAKICPNCNYEFPIEYREIKEVDGELEELRITAVKKEARKEQGKAGTFDQLVEIGRRRGYKSPEFWAKQVMKGRKK